MYSASDIEGVESKICYIVSSNAKVKQKDYYCEFVPQEASSLVILIITSVLCLPYS